MRPGACLIVALLSLSSPGLAHADEIVRLCGPRGVGFIRTATGQTCLYDTETQAPPPARATTQQPRPNPNPPASTSTNSGGSGKP